MLKYQRQLKTKQRSSSKKKKPTFTKIYSRPWFTADPNSTSGFLSVSKLLDLPLDLNYTTVQTHYFVHYFNWISAVPNKRHLLRLPAFLCFSLLGFQLFSVSQTVVLLPAHVRVNHSQSTVFYNFFFFFRIAMKVCTSLTVVDDYLDQWHQEGKLWIILSVLVFMFCDTLLKG